MDDAAVLDAPELEVADIGTETEVPEVETPVVTDEQPEVEQTPEQIAADAKLPLFKQAKAQLENIQKENPGLAAKIKDALIQYDRYKPNEIKNAVALKTEVSSLKTALNDPEFQGEEPQQILGAIKDQLGYFHGLDAKFTAGNPEFITDLAAASPESFAKLAPVVFQKFNEASPDAYSSYVSQATLNFLDRGGMPVEFEMLKAFLPQLSDSPAKDRVIASFNKLFDLTEQMRGFAAKPITPPAKKADDAATLETQRQELATREMDVTRTYWNTSGTQFGNNLIDKELSRLSGKNQVSDDQRSQIMAKIVEEVDARCAADRTYGEKMRSFLQSKDQQGYTRHLHSQYQKLIPGAVSRAYSDVVTAKPATRVVSKPAAAVAGAKPVASEGYKPVLKYPVGQVDMLKTTRKDHEAGKFILKDGSKVFFNRAARA